MLLISCNNQQFNTELKSQRYNTLPLSVCTIYQTNVYSMISSTGCNTSIACQESIIEVIHSDQADYDRVCINENTGKLIFVQSFCFLNVCVRLAQLKVMWVWTHSAFTYCDLVICGLLSQKGFSLHKCIQCPETQEIPNQGKYLYFL